jgi:alkanesulfonate monooxygenase SsuD/methylene tetrahydromethanopterin reductase-like flavin-dependent oxidoreductase (luciferase family)
VARETATLDHLSHGRLIRGVGLGASTNNELEQFGEIVDPRERARRLDDGLIRLTEFWAGEFEPRPYRRRESPSGLPPAGPTLAPWNGRPAGTASSPSACPAQKHWPR